MDGVSKAFTNHGEVYELPPTKLGTTRTSELNGSGRGRKKGISVRGSFVSVGATNRDQWSEGPSIPVGATNRNPKVPYLSRLVAPTRTKGPCTSAVWLAVGPKTKASIYLGLNGGRDK